MDLLTRGLRVVQCGRRFWVRFCRARAEERLHAAELELAHFVDDRPEVHEALRGVVEHQYLFGPQEEPAPDDTITVQRWPEAWRLIEGHPRTAEVDFPYGSPMASLQVSIVDRRQPSCIRGGFDIPAC